METVIENKKGFNLNERIKELYNYRELLWTLAYRDFKVKYAQTILGLLWAVIEPLVTAVLLSLIFNKIAKATTGGVNPILFGLSGMVVWNYFSNVIIQGSSSLILTQNMVTKIYFPRILIPSSKAIAALPDLGIAFIFTLVFYFIYWDEYTLNALILPVFLLLTVLASLGLAIWVSALNIRFRDFQHVIPFLTRIGLFLTPIAYTTSEIPAEYRWMFFLNPMTGVIEGIRWALFGFPMEIYYFSISMAVILVLFITGFYFFNRLEKNIADII
ncbi:MAG: ABC transporter permease [Saprospiraceae bacterium]|nr:ABC transporter permease [Saprospiraceae bacterium]